MFGKKKEKQESKLCLTTLIDGLPLSQDANLTVVLNPEKMFLISHSTKESKEFEIDFPKLVSVEYKSETEMNNIVSQSTPGMIIGAAAFGIIGAMVGGRVKTKQVKTVNHFLIINYTSDGQKQIVLQTNDGNSAKALSEYYSTLNPLPNKTIL